MTRGSKLLGEYPNETQTPDLQMPPPSPHGTLLCGVSWQVRLLWQTPATHSWGEQSAPGVGAYVQPVVELQTPAAVHWPGGGGHVTGLPVHCPWAEHASF